MNFKSLKLRMKLLGARLRGQIKGLIFMVTPNFKKQEAAPPAAHIVYLGAGQGEKILGEDGLAAAAVADAIQQERQPSPKAGAARGQAKTAGAKGRSAAVDKFDPLSAPLNLPWTGNSVRGGQALSAGLSGKPRETPAPRQAPQREPMRAGDMPLGLPTGNEAPGQTIEDLLAGLDTSLASGRSSRNKPAR